MISRVRSFAHTETNGCYGGLRRAQQSLTYTGASTHMHACMHACPHTWADGQFRRIFSRRHVFKHECMHILYIICTHRAAVSGDLIKYNTVATQSKRLLYYTDEAGLGCYLMENWDCHQRIFWVSSEDTIASWDKRKALARCLSCMYSICMSEGTAVARRI